MAKNLTDEQVRENLKKRHDKRLKEFDGRIQEFIDRSNDTIYFDERKKEFVEDLKTERENLLPDVKRYEIVLGTMEMLKKGEDPATVFKAIPEDIKDVVFIYLTTYYRDGAKLAKEHYPEIIEKWPAFKNVEEQNANLENQNTYQLGE